VVKKFLDERQVTYELHDVLRDKAAAREFVALGGRVLPLVVIDGEQIHGFQPDAIEAALARLEARATAPPFHNSPKETPMPDTPRLLSSKTVYNGRLFDVELDELEMDGGVVTKREILRHPGAVCMVPVTNTGDLLFVTQYRHATGGRLLELPAGTLEIGEKPLAAVARELQEEVGQKPGRIAPLGGFYVAPGYTTEYIHLFVCDELEPSVLDGDEDEDIEIERLSADEALAAIESGRICDAKSVIGVLRWLRSLNR